MLFYGVKFKHIYTYKYKKKNIVTYGLGWNWLIVITLTTLDKICGIKLNICKDSQKRKKKIWIYVRNFFSLTILSLTF